jgi:molecular chaperone HscB
MSRTFFDVLGVERRFHLSVEALEAQYRALSKQFHPDRFAKAPPKERLTALQRTTELNDAYRVLKNDVKRAEYLLKLEGLDVADEKSASVKPDPSLLMEMMERNEELADARGAGDGARVHVLGEAMRAEVAGAQAVVDEGFRKFEAGDRSALVAIAQALIARRYHARFLEQVEAFEAGAVEAGEL